MDLIDAALACRVERPDVYLRVVASLLPKQIEQVQDPLAEYSDEELAFLEKWLEAHRNGDLDPAGNTAITADRARL